MIVPTLVKLDPVIVEAKVVPVKVPALTVAKLLFTYAVVANCVELSLVAAVGAVGAPVNAGEAKGAFNKMSAVFVVMLDVFAVINPGNVAIVLELTPPTAFTVVANDPFPEPVTSPVKVVVKFAAITSVPIAKPKFVLAPAEVEAFVPPLAIEIVPLIFAEEMELSATPAFALC